MKGIYKMFYFAYGSCMNQKDFERTLVNYKKYGKAVLNNYKLAYNAYSYSRNGGVLDIEENITSQVIGILYEISEESLRKIDLREGKKYKRIVIEVICKEKKYQAFTYVIKEKVSTKANIAYSGIVYHAMLENKFPKDYIDNYIRLVRISAYGSEEEYFKYKKMKNSRCCNG